jgi:methylene-tetrahydromethanopterin dehydrogenase
MESEKTMSHGPRVLHIFTPTKNASPFDVNMAFESGYDAVVPYLSVTLDEVAALTQDAIFSRGPGGVKRTGIFIGGRDLSLALDMFETAKSAMVPPFEVSVFADPSGAITTAAAMIAAVERCLIKSGSELSGARVYVFGGTGPVGVSAGIIASYCGAEVYLASSRGKEAAEKAAQPYNDRFSVTMHGADSSSEASIGAFIADADVAIGAAKAGIRVLNAAQVGRATSLKVAADVNAVPPAGIEGVDANDFAKPIAGSSSGAVALGALAIGDIKYKVHTSLCRQMIETDSPVYLDIHQVFDAARKYAANR